MDKALRGNKLTKRPKTKGPSSPEMTRQPPKSEQEERDDSYAALGRAVTGIEGKPHSTKEGQKYAGARYLTRMWWGRDKKKKKKKGTEV
jgi:hypothetical protein